MVGTARFELAISCTPNRRVNQITPRPDNFYGGTARICTESEWATATRANYHTPAPIGSPAGLAPDRFSTWIAIAPLVLIARLGFSYDRQSAGSSGYGESQEIYGGRGWLRSIFFRLSTECSNY